MTACVIAEDAGPRGVRSSPELPHGRAETGSWVCCNLYALVLWGQRTAGLPGGKGAPLGSVPASDGAPSGPGRRPGPRPPGACGPGRLRPSCSSQLCPPSIRAGQARPHLGPTSSQERGWRQLPSGSPGEAPDRDGVWGQPWDSGEVTGHVMCVLTVTTASCALLLMPASRRLHSQGRARAAFLLLQGAPRGYGYRQHTRV